MKLGITLAQINPTVGDMGGNVALMVEAARAAQAAGTRLVVYPELSLTGYYPGDLLEYPSFQNAMSQAYDDLLRESTQFPDVNLVIGMPLQRTDGLPGKPMHNGLVVIKNGQAKLTYAKQLNPTYNIFQELRHFKPGPERAAMMVIDGVRIGFLICEDAWNVDGKEYAVNPFTRLAEAQPDIVVTINASPSERGKRETRHTLYSASAKKYGFPIVYVNQVGGQDQLVYDGASFIVSREGEVIFEAKRFETDIAHINFAKSDDTGYQGFGVVGNSLPMSPVSREGLSTMEFYRKQIILGLKDYARRCGFTKVVIGSSGGIDSAVTMALAVEALGADNVSAITMPSIFSSAGSVDDSQALCDNLGIPLLTHPIKELVEKYQAGFTQAFTHEMKGLPLENLQARVRGTILMEYSNTYGHLLLTTGNKSEISVGYATLYGDTNGGLGLIGDLFKTEVFALAEHINASAGREIIPSIIITKPPSAELAPDQKDTDSLPPYELLDEILKVEIEGSRLASDEAVNALARVAALQKTPEGVALIQRIRLMINRTEYKRRQAPPIIRLRARSFGTGRQVPITAKL